MLIFSSCGKCIKDHQTINQKRRDILNQITETVKHKNHLGGSMELIGVLLYGLRKGSSVLESMRAPGLPLFDDWSCLKLMVIIKGLHFLILLFIDLGFVTFVSLLHSWGA